jgi:asparagine synthase (glutamine-hydrolysing)
MPIKYKNRWKNKLSRFQSIFSNSEIISEKYDIPKYILKHLAKGKIPESIIWRKKMGFPVPLDNWFNKGFKQYSRELLLDNNSKTKSFLNQNRLEKLLSSEKLSSNYDYDGKKLWMLMNLELFMRKYF